MEDERFFLFAITENAWKILRQKKRSNAKETKMMENFKKYKRQYFMPPAESMKWAKKEYIDRAPIWCSVDLRDGNQALVVR